jgi:hypothetical protein
MNELRAVAIAERTEPSTPSEYLEAYQFLVNCGLAWQLEEYIGREAARLLEIGQIKEGAYEPLFKEALDYVKD